MKLWNRINEPEREVLDAEAYERIQRREAVKTWLWWAFKVICFIAIVNVAINWSNEWHRQQALQEFEAKLQINGDVEENSDSLTALVTLMNRDGTDDSASTDDARTIEGERCGAKVGQEAGKRHSPSFDQTSDAFPEPAG